MHRNERYCGKYWKLESPILLIEAMSALSCFMISLTDRLILLFVRPLIYSITSMKHFQWRYLSHGESFSQALKIGKFILRMILIIMIIAWYRLWRWENIFP